jgi:hypothetical protein
MTSHILDLDPAVTGEPRAAHYRAVQRALRTGNGGRPDLARALGRQLLGWEEFAKCYLDGAQPAEWERIGRELIRLVSTLPDCGGLHPDSLVANIEDWKP